MKAIIMLLVGIGLSLADANGWFLVPLICIRICYGSAILLAVAQAVFYYLVAIARSN